MDVTDVQIVGFAGSKSGICDDEDVMAQQLSASFGPLISGRLDSLAQNSPQRPKLRQLERRPHSLLFWSECSCDGRLVASEPLLVCPSDDSLTYHHIELNGSVSRMMLGVLRQLLEARIIVPAPRDEFSYHLVTDSLNSQLAGVLSPKLGNPNDLPSIPAEVFPW